MCRADLRSTQACRPLDDHLGRRAVDLVFARLRLLRDQLGEDAPGRGHGPPPPAPVASIHISHIDVGTPAASPLYGLSLDRLHPFSKRRQLSRQQLDLMTQVRLGFL